MDSAVLYRAKCFFFGHSKEKGDVIAEWTDYRGVKKVLFIPDIEESPALIFTKDQIERIDD